MDWLRRVGGDTTRAETVPLTEDSSATLTAVEQGKGVALARWSLVAADLAAGRLVRPMLPSVQQHSAWFLVAPPEHFSLPKVVRFRGWLIECCREFPPPTGETLPAEDHRASLSRATTGRWSDPIDGPTSTASTHSCGETRT